MRWYRSSRNTPFLTSSWRLRCVATTTRTSTGIVRSPPTRSTCRSSSTRSSFACIRIGMSPISSRNKVPWLACSNLPKWREAAPVKLPFSWPNSSLSINSAGTAAQFKVTNGPPLRGLRSCRARAMSSLRVPVSPRMQTGVSLAATRSTCAMTSFMRSPVYTISCLPTRWRRSRFSSSRRFSLRTLSTVSSSLSVESGFSRKSSAPRRVARTAISILACPLIITTGSAMPSERMSSSSAMPSLPGMTTSLSIMSKARDLARSSARAALSQTVASCPARRKARASEASVLGSSSTINRCAISQEVCNREVGQALSPANKLKHAPPMQKSSHKSYRVPRQLNAERGAPASLALHRNPPAVVADHGLHDGQAEPGAVRLGGVVRREEAGAFLRGQSPTGVRDRPAHAAGPSLSAHRERAALGHGIDRIEHQVAQHACHLLGVYRHGAHGRIQLRHRLNPRLRQLAGKQLQRVGDQRVEFHRLYLRRRHLGEVAEAAHDLLQLGKLRQQGGGAFAEDFVELLGGAVARAEHVLHRDLQGEQRVLQFMRQAPGQLAPCRDALGLHQALALRHQFAGHSIECARQGADLVGGGDIDGGVPIARGNASGAVGEAEHGAGG